MIDLRLFWIKKSKFLFVCSIVLGILTGFINLGIIFIITNVDEIIKFGGNTLFILSFIACAILYFFGNYFSLDASTRLTNKIILELRLKIQEYILASDYHEIELMGNDAIYAINNDDITKIERYAETLPRVLINIFTVSFIILYLFVLNWGGALIFIAVSIIMFALLSLMRKNLEMQYKSSRKLMDKVMGNIASLVGGIRELKINSLMRREFFHINSIPTLSAYHHQQLLKSKSEHFFTSGFLVSFYVIVAVSIFVLQDQHVENKMKFIVPLLMVFGPMTIVMSIVGIFYSAKIALTKIHALHVKKLSFAKKNIIPFKSVQINNIEYVYTTGVEDKNFVVGPVNFNIEPGKVIFIIGGNGSGKTTLIKLITGLYKISAGKIIVNERELVNEEDVMCYQSYLGVICQTPYIFSTALAINLVAKQDELLDYLKLFELQDKVVLEGNEFTNLESLSYGQKKRLGLLMVLLEDKPIYIFDEWAADQDPHFRKIFYLTILPKLKSAGKAIIAVTHDDEYFSQADKIIKLREGQQLE